MESIISISKLKFHHGGRYDVGFWVKGEITVFKEIGEEKFNLSVDDSEDLEYVILEWLKNKKKFGKVEL